MKLIVFGLGYSAGHYARQTTMWEAVTGTVRGAAKAAEASAGGLQTLMFDGAVSDPELEGAIHDADAALVSVQPGAEGDPVLARFGASLANAPRLSRVVYLSTVGVFGDHGGAWIDERTTPVPTSERGRVRLAVEEAWLAWGRGSGRAVRLLRLAGIYGPGRNALADLRAGDARRISKPGQVFNRIHVTDIGRAIDGAFAYGGENTVWNVADDEPAPAPDVIDYAAELMGLAPPPLVPFAQAELSPMARSFYAANRRVANAGLKADLGVRLAFPTYRDGLRALWAAGEGRARPPAGG